MEEPDLKIIYFPRISHPKSLSKPASIRVGFVSLVDSAPLFVAADLGIFKKYGLDVRLSREVGWATVRDKLLNEELDAAQVPCPMPLATTLGLQSLPTNCVSGLIMSEGGNAIVLSEDLWKRGVHDAQSLKVAVSNTRYFRKYVLATVYPYSAHTFLLKDWLRSGGIDPDHDVQIVTLPPSQMCRNLSAGTIDGFCAGEPWPSMAISNEIGWSPATSIDIQPGHPEKALMTKESFDHDRREQHIALVASLIEAAIYCENPANRKTVARLASDRKRVNCSESFVYECLSPRFNYGMGRIEERPRFMSFHTGSNRSDGDAALEWIFHGLAGNGQEIHCSDRSSLIESVFKSDVYDNALELIQLRGSVQF